MSPLAAELTSANRMVLVRHGSTLWSDSGRHTGRTDLELTKLGREQAELLGSRLAVFHPALVLSSPLRRAAETCQLAGLGAQMQLRSDLTEWDYGDYEGLTMTQIRSVRPNWSLWEDGGPSGEVAAQVAWRVDRIIAEGRRTPGDVVLFAHGHVLRVLCARWLALDPTQGRRFALDTASLSILGYEHDLSVICLWNDTSHLSAMDTQPPPSAASPA